MKHCLKTILLILIIFITFNLTSCNQSSDIDSYTLCTQMNKLINEYAYNGKKEEIEDKWYSLGDEGKYLDFDSLEGENGTLKVGTCDIGEPFTFILNNNQAGICFEYIYEYCLLYGYKAKITVYSNVSGLLAALDSGKIDIAADSLSITEERIETVSFTTPYFDNQIICIKRFGDDSINSKEDLSGKKVGVLTGSTLDTAVLNDNEYAVTLGYNSIMDYITALENKQVDVAYVDSSVFRLIQLTHPDIVEVYVSNSNDHYGFMVKKFGYQSTSELEGTNIGILEGSVYDDLAEKVVTNSTTTLYKDIPSLVIALQTNKIDSFVVDKSLINEAIKENSSIYTFEKALTTAETGAIFPKTEDGLSRRQDFDDFVKSLSESGKLDELIYKWENYEEGVTELEHVAAITGSSDILNVSICATMAPYTFVENNDYTGLEIDIINLYANSRGLSVHYENMEWNALMSSLSKNDMAISCIIKTEERAESVYFSKTLFNSDVVFVSMCTSAKDSSFFVEIGKSFTKTFIKENRWKLFLEGALVTLLIAAASTVLGLLLGFVLYLITYKVGNVMKKIMKWISAILNYIPVVVVLMIFYYVIFSKSSISGIIVSIIVFAILFSLSTYNMINTCVMAVDNGQYEAAFDLGYSKSKTIFKVILPQTLPQFLALLKGEIVSHLKATAIVGYIAVEDLTKMSDIVRSRTYESFFPLIATAIIYFVLAFLLIALVKKINVTIDPKKRSTKKILKGVKEHD